MRWAICQLDEIYVAGKSGGGLLKKGARVDLDAEISPGLTWAGALGEFAGQFTLEAPAPGPLTGLPVDDESGTDTKPAGAAGAKGK